MTILELLIEYVNKREEKTAFIDPARGESASWRMIYDKALRVATVLKREGVQKGDRVLITASRGIGYIEAICGVMMAGGVYVPLSENYPVKRTEYIQKDCGAKSSIDDAWLDMAMETEPAVLPEKLSPDDVSMIIYTSGSTGRPKGILHNQKGMVALLGRVASYAEFTENDVFGLNAPFYFIVHVSGVFSSLISGMTSVFIPDAVRGDPKMLAKFINAYDISIVFLSPKILSSFEKVGESLRRVLTGSERVVNIEPKGFSLINSYGLSETAGAITSFEVDRAYENTPIGKPLENITIYLLDENGRPGDEGEICVAGPLGLGYLNMPTKTASAFVKNPFRETDGHDVLYHTGDIGYRLPDGNLVYVNRKDWMIKVNGQRVELGEIECVIRRIPKIRDCAVKDFKSANGQTQLCAYYITEGGISEEEIRQNLSGTLPGYMIPSCFIELKSFPVNINGKLDRFALPDPRTYTQQNTYIPPTSELEKAICETMARVLSLPRAGMQDDFFQMGGDSITVSIFVSEFDDPRLDIRTVYQNRTPEAMARALAGKADEDLEASNRSALTREQLLTPYQTYFFDYQLYSPGVVATDIPFLVQIDRESLDLQRFEKAVNDALAYHPSYSTVLMFNDHNYLVQKYMPEKLRKAEVINLGNADVSEYVLQHEFETYRLIGDVLYKCKLFISGPHVYLFIRINHAISDGISLSNTMNTIFRLYDGKEPLPDYYYLYLDRQAAYRESEECRKIMQYMHSIHGGNGYARFPIMDRRERGNISREIYPDTGYTFGEINAWARATGYTVNQLLVAAGLLAIGRYNECRRVSMEWLYTGRKDSWTQGAVGNMLSGIPVTVDLDTIKDEIELLREVKRQSYEGIRYSDSGYAAREISPAQSDRFRIIYEHNSVQSGSYTSKYTQIPMYKAIKGMAAVFQIIVYEVGADQHMKLIVNYNAALYSDESAARFARVFVEAMKDCVETARRSTN